MPHNPHPQNQEAFVKEMADVPDGKQSVNFFDFTTPIGQEHRMHISGHGNNCGLHCLVHVICNEDNIAKYFGDEANGVGLATGIAILETYNAEHPQATKESRQALMAYLRTLNPLEKEMLLGKVLRAMLIAEMTHNAEEHIECDDSGNTQIHKIQRYQTGSLAEFFALVSQENSIQQALEALQKAGCSLTREALYINQSYYPENQPQNKNEGISLAQADFVKLQENSAEMLHHNTLRWFAAKLGIWAHIRMPKMPNEAKNDHSISLEAEAPGVAYAIATQMPQPLAQCIIFNNGSQHWELVNSDTAAVQAHNSQVNPSFADSTKQPFQDLGNSLQPALNGLSNAFSQVGSLFTSLWTAIQPALNMIGQLFQSLITGLVSCFSGKSKEAEAARPAETSKTAATKCMEAGDTPIDSTVLNSSTPTLTHSFSAKAGGGALPGPLGSEVEDAPPAYNSVTSTLTKTRRT